MLVHEQVEFHGVAELHPVGGDALRLQRLPEKVRLALNPKAARRMLAPDGAEIRFVSAGSDVVEVTLSAPETPCELIAFWGGFQDLEKHVIGREPTTLRLTYPERLSQLIPQAVAQQPFHPRVWRLTLRGMDKHGIVHFHEIRGCGLRPPRVDEKPARTYMAYGTSITDGFSAGAMHLSFISQTARRLGMDYVNLGSAGSAYCEPEVADYIAQRRDWHVATLCVSANMIGAQFGAEEFRSRAAYLVNTIAGADASRQIFCITVLPYFADFCRGIGGPHGQGLAPLYRQALRQVVSTCGRNNVHLIEGADLLTDISGYTADLIHPGDAGMTQIAENLAARMQSELLTPM